MEFYFEFVFRYLFRFILEYKTELLFLLILVAVSCLTAWPLSRIRFLKKLNWKIFAGMLVLFRIFDIHSTCLLITKVGHELEGNLIIRWILKNSGFAPIWALIIYNLIWIPLLIYLIKVIINGRKYFWVFFAIMISFWIVINNYIGYLFVAL